MILLDVNKKIINLFEVKYFTVWDIPYRDTFKFIPYQIHGSCPLEIPIQCIYRYTKEDDIILDPFCGAGTTIIASALLNRKGIGIEINKNILDIAKKNIEYNYHLNKIPKQNLDKQKIIPGNSLYFMNCYLRDNTVDLIFAHPPYWGLIKYSYLYGDSKGDISTAEQLEDFLNEINIFFKGFQRVLKNKGHLCILIGDFFTPRYEVIPLDNFFTNLALSNNFEFINKIIKISHNTKSKFNNMESYKKKSLESNFFICNHDYLLIFKKK